MSKFLTVIFLIFCFGLTNKAQESNLTYKNEIGISPFRLEMNEITLHNSFEPKLMHGLYFNRGLQTTNWSWVVR